MIYDYVIIGNNLNSLMIAYYLFKEGYKIVIIDKKNEEELKLYYDKNIVINNPLYSNNDVNFLNFLNDLSINFRSIGRKCKNINFNLVQNFKIGELVFIFSEFFKEFTFDYSSKNIKLIDKIYIFSDKSITYIKTLCDFYEFNFDTVTLYDFMQMINNCITGEFFTIEEYKLLDNIFNYFIKNTNIDIINEEFLKFNSDKNIETNKRNITFLNNCIFSHNSINDNIYNYTWKLSNEIDEKVFDNYNFNYIKNENEYTFFSNKDNINEIKKTFFFLDNNYEAKIVTHSNNKSFNDNYIIINNQNNIESNIINNYRLLNKLINKEKYKHYNNDSLIDVLKLILAVKLFV